MKKGLAAGLVVGLAGLVAAGWWVWSGWFSPVARATEQVRALLKDPDSAKFDQVTVHPGKGTVCGYVNAKNGMGGYAGSRAFILFPDGDIRWQPPGEDTAAPTAVRLEQVQLQINFVQLASVNCPAS